MTRQRSRLALRSALLPAILSACVADSTGPDDEDPVPQAVFDNVVVSIRTIDVTHDCDPATDNPGDFQAWVTIRQDALPGPDVDSRQVAISAKKTLLIDSGGRLSVGTELWVEGRVARVPEREVEVFALVRELDNGVVDLHGDQEATLSWSEELSCWAQDGLCLTSIGGGYQGTWSTTVSSREDVFDLFNPDDEGCEFHVWFAASITEPDDPSSGA